MQTHALKDARAVYSQTATPTLLSALLLREVCSDQGMCSCDVHRGCVKPLVQDGAV